MTDAGAARARRPGRGGGDGDLPLRPPEPPRDPLEFLSRSWSASSSAADHVSRALAPALAAGAAIAEDVAGELDADSAGAGAGGPASGSSFSFASAATSQLVLDRIMAPAEVAPLTSGRLSHSSGPLNGGGSLSDSPPVSPELDDDTKFCRAVSTPKPQPYARGGSKTVGRWLKDRRERRKEEARAHNAQVHAAVSVAAVAAAIAAVAAATAAASSSAGNGARTDMAVASAATLVAAQCVEAAEALGAERDHLAAAVASAVSVRTPGDVVTVTAAAATALRGAATLRARALKEAWSVAAVIPVEKGAMGGGGGHHQHDGGYKHDGQQQRRQLREVESSNSSSSCFSDELVLGEENNFLGICTQELLARGTELLKRTRKGSLHWKVVSVYINRAGLVMLKMKSRHVGGTITKKKKSVVVDVCRDVAAWPGRHLLEGGEQQRRYFGLRTAEQRVIEFECGSQREHEIWTKGVARLLAMVDARKR